MRLFVHLNSASVHSAINLKRINSSNQSTCISCCSDGVGTDTPPQTPPNVKGQQGQQGQGAGLLGSGSFLGGSSSGSYGGSMSGGLSSCSRGSTAPLSAQGVGGGPVGDTSLHQRYQGGGGSHAPPHNTNTATSLPNTAFTPVYKK